MHVVACGLLGQFFLNVVVIIIIIVNFCFLSAVCYFVPSELL